jgi:hypothetical protein
VWKSPKKQPWSRRIASIALLTLGLASAAGAEDPGEAEQSQAATQQGREAAAQRAEGERRRAPAKLDLIGTWHVLVHYTDDNANDSKQLRWDDRIWIFESTGSRLRWDEFPIVVFGDNSDRFEHLGTNRARRITGAWEPNPKQFSQILDGLEVNDRGMKSKKLRKVEGDGWRSQSASRSVSASVLSYVEHWSIEGTPGRPVFRREDQLGAERSEGLDGVTLYSTTRVDPSGDLLQGDFERDGTRHGSFRMLRAAPVSGVKGSGKSQSERVLDVLRDQYFRRVVPDEPGDGGGP